MSSRDDGFREGVEAAAKVPASMCVDTRTLGVPIAVRDQVRRVLRRVEDKIRALAPEPEPTRGDAVGEA